jgi:hypothetical protein
LTNPKRPEEGPTMKALAPWTGFESLRKEMERFFDRFGDWEFPELRSLGESSCARFGYRAWWTAAR